MKAPKPNRDQCIAVTRKLLEFHAIRQSGPPLVNTYYAMSYNPYGYASDYGWSLVRKYLDVDGQVLLGSSFWDMVGGPGTYDEVLDIFKEIGNENRAALLNILR